MNKENINLKQHDKDCECKFCKKRVNIEMNKEEERKEIVKMLKRI
ncbi:hypothetical protein [Neobacillus cucumis]|nr:hypothetical protein [Neobacillus cucumis]